MSRQSRLKGFEEEIKSKYTTGEYTRTQLATEYNVSIATLNRVLAGEVKQTSVRKLRWQEQAVFDDYNGGMPKGDIAEKYGVSRESVSIFIASKTNPHLKMILDKDKEKIYKKRGRGVTMFHLAKEYNVPHQAMVNFFGKADRHENKKGRLKNHKQDIMELYLNGLMTQAQLAVEYQVSRSAIHKVVNGK